MDKLIFLASLAEKLSHYPISNEDIEKHIRTMKQYFDTVSDEEFARENPTEDDVAAIAEGLYKKYHITPEPQSEADEEVPDVTEIAAQEEAYAQIPEEQNMPELTEEETAEEEISEEIEAVPAEPMSADDYFDALAKEAEEERRDQEIFEELKQKAIERAIAENDELLQNLDIPLPEAAEADEAADAATVISDASAAQENEYDPVEAAVDPYERPDIAFDENEATRIFSTGESEVAELVFDIEEEKNSITVDDKKLKKVDPAKVKKNKKARKQREKVEGTPLFWVIFFLTLPITLPLIVALGGIFASIYVLITVIIIAFAAATVACVAGGSALSLYSIIYGITLIVSKGAVGVYELGVGITVGGIVMLASLLLYNTSMRFAPLLYKHLTLLAKYLIDKIADLYYYLKKEVGR